MSAISIIDIYFNPFELVENDSSFMILHQLIYDSTSINVIRFSTFELVENDSSFMILLQIVPNLSSPYIKKITLGGQLGFLGQGDLQTKN